MHPRSPYADSSLDFARLARKYPRLGKVIKHSTIDFTDAAVNREISRSLLLEYHGLDIEFPPDRLCPPIPNRLNYVLWIEDIVAETLSKDHNDVVGIDVGTGASAIYPLLCCRQNPAWHFYALEADEESLHSARLNIGRNNMQDRVSALKSDIANSHLLSQHQEVAHGTNAITFTMCNPPFYESLDDMHISESSKSSKPNSSCSGAPCEMITPGGEVQFTRLHIEDSLVLLDRVQWFSTMLGKLSSLRACVEMLRARSITNYAVTEFTQGQTKRWGLAWSFMPWRPLGSTSRAEAYALQDLLPLKPNFSIDLSEAIVTDVPIILEKFVVSYAHDWKWTIIKKTLTAAFTHNTWSRQARRRRARPREAKGADRDRCDDDEDADIKVVFRVELVIDPAQSRLDVLWRFGLDHALFESFCGRVKQQCLMK